MRTCNMCGVEKELDQFKRVGPNGGRMWNCLPCYTENRRDNKRHERTWRDIHLRRRYNITEEDFNEMVEKQEGLCAICKRPELNGYKGRTDLCVDHNHETGTVRGLLCNHCNRALGLFGDNLSSLQNAVEYIANDQRQNPS